MTPQRLRLILPSHVKHSSKIQKEKAYLSRRLGVDETDFLVAALRLWDYPDLGRFETNSFVLNLFREFIEDEFNYTQCQIIACLLQRVLAEIQTTLKPSLEMYLEGFFKDMPVKLELERFLDNAFIVALTLNENLDENPSTLENHSLDR